MRCLTIVNVSRILGTYHYGEAFCPREIADRSICIDGDIGEVLELL